MNRKKVFVLGSFVMDLIVNAKRFPDRGETVLGETFSTAPGGKGANQAVQMGLLGLDVAMQGKVGNDDFGRVLVESAEAAGVDVSRVGRDGSFSAVGNVQIETREDGSNENRIIVVPGANLEISAQDVENFKEEIKNFDYLVQQQEIPLDINRETRKIAFEQGVEILLNPAPSYLLEDEDYKYISYLVPNEHELAELTGAKSEDFNDIETVVEHARQLINKGCPNVIVTLGSKGSCWVTADDYVYVEALKNVKSIDPTAAGDSFIGAFVFTLANDFEKAECLRFSNYVGALTVSKAGAQTSLSKLQEVYEYAKEHEDENSSLLRKIEALL